MSCEDTTRPLTFETMLEDPLVRMVMAADGVSLRELVAVLKTARDNVAARERVALMRATRAPRARSVPV